MQIAVLNQFDTNTEIAKKFALDNKLKYLEDLNLDHSKKIFFNRYSKEYEFLIRFGESGIYLTDIRGNHQVDILVDFLEGANAHRRYFGGGKNQAIAKAVGINKNKMIRILDATAGFGADAFVLAGLGSFVDMVERSAIVQLLLADGLHRANHYAAEHDQELASILNRMSLIHSDSIQWMRSNIDAKGHYDVVYLDPMFPISTKSAKVKKEMAVLHSLIGLDHDDDQLLELALSVAKFRVVVKRARLAPLLANRQPTMQIVGKSSRFDVFVLRKMTNDR